MGSIPSDETNLRRAIDALNTVEAGKRVAATGAAPAATAALAGVQAGKMAVADLEPVFDENRLSEATVRRLDHAATPPVGGNANDRA